MRYLLILTGVLLVCTGRLTAQEDDVPTFEDTIAVYEELFNNENPLQLTLKLDLKTFRKTKQKGTYLPAELTCDVNENFRVTHPVRIKARGIWRKDHCSFPPFWLNIRYSGIEADSLRDLDVNRMKMVIRCRPSAPFEHYILREYLIYKIYNKITPYSYRARLVKLKFIDTSKDDETWEDWAFLIEPSDLMNTRLNAVMIKNDKLSIRSMNPEMMNLVAMFQYMIGNGDFSVTGRHNIKIIAVKPPGPSGVIPITYDFDYSGLVDAHYAVPQENLGIASVKERYYLGPCRPDEDQMVAIQKIASHKDQIIDYVKGFEYLDEEERNEIVTYLEEYFLEAEDERFISRHITPTCR
jgi:hypothetical protein